MKRRRCAKNGDDEKCPREILGNVFGSDPESGIKAVNHKNYVDWKDVDEVDFVRDRVSND